MKVRVACSRCGCMSLAMEILDNKPIRWGCMHCQQINNCAGKDDIWSRKIYIIEEDPSIEDDIVIEEEITEEELAEETLKTSKEDNEEFEFGRTDLPEEKLEEELEDE